MEQRTSDVTLESSSPSSDIVQIVMAVPVMDDTDSDRLRNNLLRSIPPPDDTALCYPMADVLAADPTSTIGPTTTATVERGCDGRSVSRELVEPQMVVFDASAADPNDSVTSANFVGLPTIDLESQQQQQYDDDDLHVAEAVAVAIHLEDIMVDVRAQLASTRLDANAPTSTTLIANMTSSNQQPKDPVDSPCRLSFSCLLGLFMATAWIVFLVVYVFKAQDQI